MSAVTPAGPNRLLDESSRPGCAQGVGELAGRNQSAVVCGAVDDLLAHACKVGDERRHRS
jgi:hypothetical protein